MHRSSLVLLLSTVSIVSLSAHSVQARRQLVPDQPSVEVRMDALRALRRSVQAPVQPIYDAPSSSTTARQAIPSNIPFGAPTPPPVRQASPVTAPPQYAPVPQRSTPKAIATPKPQPAAPIIKETIAEPSIMAKAPVKAKPKPKAALKKVAAPVPKPKIALPQPEKNIAAAKVKPKAAPPKPTLKTPPVAPVPTMDFDDFDDLPPLEIVEENTSDADIQEFTLDSVAPEAPEIKKSEPVKQVVAAKKEALPEPSALPEPNLEDLDFESFGAEEPEFAPLTLAKTKDVSEKNKKPLQVTAVKDNKKTVEPLPKLDLPKDANIQTDAKPVNADKSEVVNIEEPIDENITTIEKELAALNIDSNSLPSLDTFPEEVDIETDMSDADIDATLEAPVATPATLPTPPKVEAETVTAPKPATPPIPVPVASSKIAAPKEEGLLPSIKSSIRSFLGGEEKEELAPAPASLPPLPEVKESARSQPPLAALPPFPSDDNVTSATTLPPLPPENNASTGNAGLPALPDFGSENDNESSLTPNDSLPPLPSFGTPQNSNNVDVFETANNDTNLPPLPGLPMTETEKTQTSIASIVPDDVVSNNVVSFDNASLPSLDSLDIISNTNQNADLTVLFSQSETEVPLSYQQPLINLSKDLIANANSKIKVIAYASASDDQSSIAKRISLARALAVRAFLIDLGVDNVRISVQALGNEPTSGATERADVIVLN